MDLKKTMIIAVVFTIVALVAWECYWRAQGTYPTVDDNKDLWAVQRGKVETATPNDVVIVGSSRALFDLQLDEFTAQTGKRPIQLASPGSSPLPVFHDLVTTTQFNGTIIVGVAPGLFFSTTFPGAFPWKRPLSKVNHYHNRTYAQALNHWLSLPLQRSLVLLSANEEEWSDDIDLRALIGRIRIGNRTGDPDFPPFYCFSDADTDRNTIMTSRTVTDTAFAGTVKRVWGFFGKMAPPPDKKATMAYFLADVKKFEARGGKLILVRCPSSGGVRAAEDTFMPRAAFWDDLVRGSNCPNYYFSDYPQLPSDCPEWSHLSAAQAKIFTTELVKVMIADGTLQPKKR